MITSPRPIAGVPMHDVATPKAVRRLGGPSSIRVAWENEAGGITFELGGRGDGPSHRFVKWAPIESCISYEPEIQRHSWLSRFPLRVPRVLDAGQDGEGRWLMTAALDGENAIASRWIAEPARAVASIGVGLRELHSCLPVEDCPFSWSTEERSSHIVTDRRRWDGDFRHLRLDEVIETLGNPPTVDQQVVCHGDACAPNTLVDDDGMYCGHVDLGALGVADRWADLAVATWATVWNYGPGWERPLLDAYGIEPDEERTRYYRLLWAVT